MKNLSTLNVKSPQKNTGFWRLLFSFCIGLFSVSGAYAQIVTDGDPADWDNFTSNYPAHAMVEDVINASGNTDDQFTQGTKDEDLIQSWRWSNGSSNAKGDIGNAGAALIGCNLHFFVDRYAVNGDASIGFWFLKDPIAKVGAKKFSGAHQDGDILILSNFTNGGGTSLIYEYQWQGSGPGSLVQIGVSNLAMVNDQVYDVPDDWSYTPKTGTAGTYPIGSFYEGEINLCAIFDNQVPCFATFVAETRNSQSITASLQDFALGSFTADVAAPIVAIETQPSICGPATGCVVVDLDAERAGTYTLTQLNGTPMVFTYPADGDTVRFCGLVAGGGFSVVFETVSGCASEPAVCPSSGNTARKAGPAVNSKPLGSSQMRQEAGKDLVAYPVPFNDKVNVKFTAARAEKYSINLYDMNGKLVRELKTGYAKTGEVIQMEVSGKGLLEKNYLVRKVSKSGVSTLRIMKEK